MKDGRKLLLKYSITVAVGAAVAAFLVWQHDLFGTDSIVRSFHILSDAFVVPGVLLLMVGVLIWVANFGIFDMLGYAGSRVGMMFIPSYKKYDHQTYYDYKERRKDKRISGYSFILHVGLAFFAVGVVFLILYFIKSA